MKGNSDQLKELKTAARNIARARRIKHIGALEVIAQALGYSHWNALTNAEKNGWRPPAEDLATAEALVFAENPLISIDTDPWRAIGHDKFEGELLGHSYRVSTQSDDVRMWGRGWEVTLPEAPLAPARFRVTDRRLKANPIDDTNFRNAALEIASGWRKLVHARMSYGRNWVTRPIRRRGDPVSQTVRHRW
ncbi:glyoxalase superfamily protein [Mesorhizobium sp. ArgA1]